jgi:hypothetical protein
MPVPTRSRSTNACRPQTSSIVLNRYRRGDQTDAMGRLILRPTHTEGSGGGGDGEETHTMTQGFT